MRLLLSVVFLLAHLSFASAQITFNTGWKDVPVGYITYEYNYNYSYKDSFKFYFEDSSRTFTTPDSLISMTQHYGEPGNAFKTVNYYSTNKLLTKREEYRGTTMLETNEWKYDDKQRLTFHAKDDKANGKSFKETYKYQQEKDGGYVIEECASTNGKVMFYTKDYYNSKNVKYKEVRLNDNNQDVVHVETYHYDDSGWLVERSVFFPEFKVTKKFPNTEERMPVKCYRVLPIPGDPIKLPIVSKTALLKRVLTKELPVLLDKACRQFKYRFTNHTNCDIVVSPTGSNNMYKAVLRIKVKV
jgi:hypothetical protein